MIHFSYFKSKKNCVLMKQEHLAGRKINKPEKAKLLV